MVWKIHILTFNCYLPLFSTSLLMRRICIDGRYDEKVGQITTGRPSFAFFCDCGTRSQLSFLNNLITRAPCSGNWCRYSNVLNKNPSKEIFPHTSKSRSRHTFPITILARLLPKFLITKEVCSKSTSIVFPSIPYLVPALAQNFCMLHVTMYWQEIWVSCKMTNFEIFYAKAKDSGNLSRFHSTRTLVFSWMHVERMPGHGPRKMMSNSTLLPNGLSRSSLITSSLLIKAPGSVSVGQTCVFMRWNSSSIWS